MPFPVKTKEGKPSKPKPGGKPMPPWLIKKKKV